MYDPGHKIEVLDKGFVQFCTFMDKGDMDVVEAARVSFGQDSKGPEKDKKLLFYLMEHGHETPFEHSVFKFIIKSPIFVARQWMRHRWCSYNEISGRYTVFDDTEFYIPEKMRVQEKRNKQGSEVTDEITEDIHQWFSSRIGNTTMSSVATYKEMLSLGVAKEVARMILPVNMYTQFYWTVNARSLMNFLRLRMDKHAQWEIRQYADAIYKIFCEKMPWTSDAFDTYYPVYF